MFRPAIKMAMLLFVIIFSSSVNAAFEQKGGGSLFYGAGSTGLASKDSSFCVMTNPAKVAALGKARMDFMFRNFYQIGGLNQIAMNGVFKVAGLPIGLSVSRYGNKLYSEMETRLALGYELIKSLYLGGSLNGYWLSVKNYGQASSMGFSLAGYYRFLPKMSTAFLVENINEPVIGAAKEKLPLSMTLGFAYLPFKALELNMDVVKDNQFDFEYRFGVRYRLNRWLGFVSGFREQTNTFSGGFFITRKNLLFGYALEYHQTLGNNHSISLGYVF